MFNSQTPEKITSQLRRILKITTLFLLIIPSYLSVPPLSAQSLSEFELWKKQQMGEFKQYKDEMDKEFADFLKKRWKPFDTEDGVVRDKAPKPLDIPVAKVKDQKPVVKAPQPVKPVPVIPVVKIPKPEPVKVINLPLEIPQTRNEKLVAVKFLGHQLSILDGLSSSVSSYRGMVSQAGIQKTFSELAQSEYAKTVTQLLKIKRELVLNDWAYMSLINRFTEKLPVVVNQQKVVSWFLLLKSGLDARVAFDSRNVYLLVAARQSLYDVAYFTFGSQKYYAVSGQKNLPVNLYSYDGRYPKKLQVSDFSIQQAIISKQDKRTKRLSFSYQRKTYHLDVPYNSFTVDFLSTYPQMDIDQYFRTPLDNTTANALLLQLRPIVKGMTETEAVNLLLRFSQKAFRYETDQDQFGEENYMFIEETIFYPASDCEDRSIIFAWLVKNLLDLEVIGLDFPGHIATAVKLKKPLGQVIPYQNKRFTIADPTYINARAGMKMPQFKNIAPKVISIL